MISTPKNKERRFEAFFVFGVILAGGFIHSMVPYRMAFLNLYAIPVLMAAYYLDLRQTLLGGVACVLLTLLNVRMAPERFISTRSTTELYASLAAWAFFLLLSAILVYYMRTKLLRELDRNKSLGQQVVGLKDRDALKDRYMRSVTHDLKAPLNAIQAYAQLMLSGQALSATQQRQLGIICSATDDLTRFIEDILDLSKSQAGCLQLEKNTIPIKDILQWVYDLQKASAEKFGIVLSLKVEDSLPPVNVDQYQLTRVVTNLVFNAFKFTPDKGTVEMSAAREGPSQIIVRVKDSGVGIPKDMLPTIFDRFAQLNDTRKKARVAGTGLGLGISKAIVDSHGGRIWAESDGQHGSVLSFILPVAGSPEQGGT